MDIKEFIPNLTNGKSVEVYINREVGWIPMLVVGISLSDNRVQCREDEERSMVKWFPLMVGTPTMPTVGIRQM